MRGERSEPRGTRKQSEPHLLDSWFPGFLVSESLGIFVSWFFDHLVSWAVCNKHVQMKVEIDVGAMMVVSKMAQMFFSHGLRSANSNALPVPC